MKNISHTKILPYQPSWVDKFESEKKLLQNVFGHKAIQIEHIGSTSIVGLPAKPIIDIAVLIDNYQDADSFATPLGKIGYQCDFSGNERSFCIKGDPIEYHLSIAYNNRGGFLKRQVLFRDYLRQHEEHRKEYANLKRGLLKRDKSGLDGYISGKSDFVYKILELADWKGK